MFQNYLSFIHSSSVTTVIFLGSPLEGKNAGFVHHCSTKGIKLSEFRKEKWDIGNFFLVMQIMF